MRVAHALGVVAVFVVVGVGAGTVIAAGDTTVQLGAADESVGVGETVTYELYVTEAASGVGSFNATVAVNDSSVATIESVSYAGNPSYANQPGGGESGRLTGTGMDTIDSGPVEIATVTVRAENPGAVGLTVRVAALGDENGSAYAVTGTEGQTLTVEGGVESGDDDNDGGANSDSGSNETETGDNETDDSGSNETETGGNETADGGSNETEAGGNETDDDSGGGEPPAATPTATPSQTETGTAATETGTQQASGTAAAAESPTATATLADGESGPPLLAGLAAVGGLLVVLVGIRYYQGQ